MWDNKSFSNTPVASVRCPVGDVPLIKKVSTACTYIHYPSYHSSLLLSPATAHTTPHFTPTTTSSHHPSLPLLLTATTSRNDSLPLSLTLSHYPTPDCRSIPPLLTTSLPLPPRPPPSPSTTTHSNHPSLQHISPLITFHFHSLPLILPLCLTTTPSLPHTYPYCTSLPLTLTLPQYQSLPLSLTLSHRHSLPLFPVTAHTTPHFALLPHLPSRCLTRSPTPNGFH